MLFTRKKTFCLFLTILLCLTILFACAENAGSVASLYRITGGTNEMVILGSIHIGSEDMYPLGRHITDALNDADTLVFECDTESAEVLASMMGMMTYPTGDSLRNHIGPMSYAFLEATADAIGYPVSSFNALKPWAVVSTLSLQTSAAQMGVSDLTTAMNLGVETQIRQLSGNKPEAYLETAMEQLSIMDNFSPALQELLLFSSCQTILMPEMISEADANVRFWPQWWHDGEEEAFAHSYYAGMKDTPLPALLQEYHDGLVTKRNANMAQRLSDMLTGGEGHSYFVTIGILHLALPGDSVLSELEKQGYQVERIRP